MWEKVNLLHNLWKYKFVQLQWNTVQKYLKKTKNKVDI